MPSHILDEVVLLQTGASAILMLSAILTPIFFVRKKHKEVEKECLKAQVPSDEMVRRKMKAVLPAIWHPIAILYILFLLLSKPHAYEYKLEAVKNPPARKLSAVQDVRKQQEQVEWEDDGFLDQRVSNTSHPLPMIDRFGNAQFDRDYSPDF